METISIRAPLKGEWKFLRPPGHHPFAFDFVQMDRKRRSSHNSSKLLFIFGHISSNKFFCWNQPVYAPIDGEIIRVGNGWNDHEYTNIWKAINLWYNATYKFKPKEENGRLDIRPNAGNHIMIQAKEGYIVFLAHLRNQSIVVKEGEHVSQGQEIARLGSSGNSTMPHLHMNLFDQMNKPYLAKVLPFVFSDYETLSPDGKWVENTLSLPRVGTVMKFNS